MPFVVRFFCKQFTMIAYLQETYYESTKTILLTRLKSLSGHAVLYNLYNLIQLTEEISSKYDLNFEIVNSISLPFV